MGKIIALLVVGVIIAGIFGSGKSDPNQDSPAKLWDFEKCMDNDTFIRQSKYLANQIDWEQVENSALWPEVMKTAFGSRQLVKEMERIGTKPCPEIKGVYDKIKKQLH